MSLYNPTHAAYMAEGREDDARADREREAASIADQIADTTADLYGFDDMAEVDLPLRTLLPVRQALASAALAGMEEGMPR